MNEIEKNRLRLCTFVVWQTSLSLLRITKEQKRKGRPRKKKKTWYKQYTVYYTQMSKRVIHFRVISQWRNKITKQIPFIVLVIFCVNTIKFGFFSRSRRRRNKKLICQLTNLKDRQINCGFNWKCSVFFASFYSFNFTISVSVSAFVHLCVCVCIYQSIFERERNLILITIPLKSNIVAS